MAVSVHATRQARPAPWSQIVRNPRLAVALAALFLVAGLGRLAHALVEGGDLVAWAGSWFFVAAGLGCAVVAALTPWSARRI